MNIFSKNLRKKLKKSHFLPLINSEGVNFPTLSKRRNYLCRLMKAI